MRFSNFLNEAVYKFSNSDINKIMDVLKKPREKIIKLLKKGSVDEVYDYVDEIKDLEFRKDIHTYVIKTLDTSIFKSSPLSDAHKLNPVKIHIGFSYGPHYNVHQRAIVVGLRMGSLEDSANWAYAEAPGPKEFSDVSANLGQLATWYSLPKVRSDVVHEITHWLDDSFHKKFLTKKFTGQRFIEKYVKKDTEAYITEPFEINSIINGVSDMKKLLQVKISKEMWDNLTWDDFLGLDPFLANLDELYGAKFRRILRKRMAKEKLLGKKMR